MQSNFFPSPYLNFIKVLTLNHVATSSVTKFKTNFINIIFG